MSMLRKRALVAALLAMACACAVAGTSAPPSQNRHTTRKQPATASATAEGEKRFRAHCGRCHNPPEDLSAREARAVVRQMRVRAMLSAEDEKLILEYLAP